MSDIPLNINYKAGNALIAALKHRDEYTQNHCVRVGEIAVKTAQLLHYSASEIEQLELASIFHDIGKIGIPDRILLNPDKLNEAEYEIMKTHVEVGANIVEKLDVPNAEQIAKIILHHHENYDGSGYPNNLKNEEIPLSSRIIRVIDTFDALTSARVYRQAIDSQAALDKMQSQMVELLDPEVFKLVAKVISEGNYF